MSCYNPKKGFVIGLTKNHRPKLKIMNYEYNWMDDKGIFHTTPPPYGDDSILDRYIEIPCGHCLGCRQAQSKEWASRLIMEMMYHENAYFITLTYDDEHVKQRYYFDESTGEVDWIKTLDKRDVQLFNKRLREKFNKDKIRFYVAGEYGSNTNRPHYHGIYYGLEIEDMKYSGRSEAGHLYFTSPTIQELWKNGFVSVEKANYATCKYVASYVTKKIGNKPNEIYLSRGQVPPFSLSSRKPGIGYRWFEDHFNELYDLSDIRIPMYDGSYKITIPRYFLKKMYEMDPDRNEKFSEKRQKAAEDQKELIMENTNLNWIDYLKVKERSHEQKLKERNKI